MQRVPQDSRALELAKLANPEYGCIYDWMMLSRVPIWAPRSPYPFPLDGAAWDRKETGVILMQRILYKMILINHPVVRVCKEEVGELKDLLSRARCIIWTTRKHFPPGHDGAGRVENTELFRGKGMLVPGMDLKMKGVPTAGQLRMWEVFKIIFWGSSQLTGLAVQAKLKKGVESVEPQKRFLLQKSGDGTFVAIMDQVIEEKACLKDNLVYFLMVYVIINCLFKDMCGSV